MSDKNAVVYPYIPNSAPETAKSMLEAVGAADFDDFYRDIPESLRVEGSLRLPEPHLSEYELKRHITSLIGRNRTCETHLSFLGAGCFQHHVPAVCDEVNRRSEFLTAYAGEPYEDHGRFQALFETASMMGELLEMDVVNVPTYDGYQAAATALRMAARITGRRRLLVSAYTAPDKMSKIKDYIKPDLELVPAPHDPSTGGLDLDALRDLLDKDTAALYFENPCFLGHIELRGREAAVLAHQVGAECVVGVDPISLGVLAPPALYGADIVCGDLQPLGMHMSYGGGQAGFIATRDEVRYVMEYPSRLFGIAPTRVEGEYGFGDVAWERTSFAVREGGKEWVGTAAALWGITAGVYLALMGPQGMKEIGEGIMQRSKYAMVRLAELPGVRCPVFPSPSFKEFVVDFRETGRRVADINRALLERNIFGGPDIGIQFPSLSGCALYCVTEVHSKSDIDTLASALNEVLQ